MLLKRRLALAAVLSALILAARLSPSPALVDAATGGAFAGARLAFPWLHVLLTPLTSWADAVVCNSARQDGALLAFLLILYGPFRFFVLGHARAQWRDPWLVVTSFGKHFLLVLAFVAFAVFCPRPAARLELDDPDLLAVDLHSHTAASWDGRRGFSPAESARWHARMGFGAAFVTDHNTMAAAGQGSRESRRAWDAGDKESAALLEGEELSLDGAHVVLLGPAKAADPNAYPGPDGLRRFLGDAQPVYGGLAVLSLPEYWRYHWDELEALVDAGARGIEVVTASPKAMEFREEGRRRVVDLCRRRGLFLSAGTDNHGWAQACCAWSLVRVHGWRAFSPAERQSVVMSGLRGDGYAAVRVAAKARVDPAESDWTIFLDAPRSLWLQARGWTLAQSAAALAWAWAFPAAAWLRKRREGI